MTVCYDIQQLRSYGYIFVDDFILFFGGWNGKLDRFSITSNLVYKYAVQESKWTKMQNTLPSPLRHCSVVLSKMNKYFYVGGYNEKKEELPIHVKVNILRQQSSYFKIITLLQFFFQTGKRQIFDEVSSFFKINYLSLINFG
ncbi:hypothetical protein RFI_03072 [Reticulomyxa filosa]|uniref:Kelch motif family protein n=1 Tax=Reticulomyxa filosa TaxID=46433 RepID=X6P8P1_RETFI|nr:hypothetical protein RFI_03072 [Reticulomyxa filosa]|eukprot:ETO34022.1 hypothetical protein RFI_03072 [Reticulomyxa filosa]